MDFSKITYQPLNGPLAQVDRRTFELFIDDEKWNLISKLENADLYKEFILLHENGHITLQDSNEFRVNRYAISKFLRKIAELSNEELGVRVIVLSDLLENDFQGNVLYKSNISKMEGGVDPTGISSAIGGLADMISSVFGALPALGVGTKSRKKEMEKQAELAMKLQSNQSKSLQKSIIISGIILVILISLFLILKQK